jgi:ribosome maturation factor RimP
LRTPQHFRGAVGERVTLREAREGEPTRRLEGVLTAADDTSATLQLDDGTSVTVSLEKLERARTLFAWGGTPKPSPSRAPAAAGKRK